MNNQQFEQKIKDKFPKVKWIFLHSGDELTAESKIQPLPLIICIVCTSNNCSIVVFDEDFAIWDIHTNSPKELDICLLELINWFTNFQSSLSQALNVSTN